MVTEAMDGDANLLENMWCEKRLSRMEPCLMLTLRKRTRETNKWN